MLTKEECEKALDHFEKCYWDQDNSYGAMNGVRKDLDILNKLIHEHFDNPPITVSDIPYEKELICWDNAEKEWCSIYSEGGEVSIAYFQLPTVYTMYETFDKKHGNRFYRKEVHE